MHATDLQFSGRALCLLYHDPDVVDHLFGGLLHVDHLKNREMMYLKARESFTSSNPSLPHASDNQLTKSMIFFSLLCVKD